MQKRRTLFRWGRLLFYAVLLLFFALLPYEAAEGGMLFCPSAALGFQCPGCGVTRAMTLLMKFRFAEAFWKNSVFTSVIFPLFLAGMIQDIFVVVTRRKLSLFEYILGLENGSLGGL